MLKPDVPEFAFFLLRRLMSQGLALFCGGKKLVFTPELNRHSPGSIDPLYKALIELACDLLEIDHFEGLVYGE